MSDILTITCTKIINNKEIIRTQNTTQKATAIYITTYQSISS